MPHGPQVFGKYLKSLIFFDKKRLGIEMSIHRDNWPNDYSPNNRRLI